MTTKAQAQRAAFGRYIVDLKLQMWLGVWRIDIEWADDPGEDAIASIRPVYGQKRATLRICRDFFSMEPWEQRRSLVHELLHCYAADVQELGEQLRTNLGDPAHEAWLPGWRLAVEHMVDGLSTLLAGEDTKLFPLPNFNAPASRGKRSGS